MTDSLAVPVVVSVIGPPGSGKSTLCSALSSRWAAEGLIVDHFEERDILTRSAFSAVADEFADGTGAVNPQTLIDAFGRYVDQGAIGGIDVLLTDALIPFIPSLLAWGHTEVQIEQILNHLEAVAAPVPVIVVLLTGDPEILLSRAIQREGTGWADWYITKLSNQPGTSGVVSLPTAVDQLRSEEAVGRRLLARSRWKLITIDALGEPEQIFELAQRRLVGLVPPSPAG